MKWMIASDIHGSAKWCRMMLARYKEEGCGRLLLLGDLLYHGPRNELPEEYAPKDVIQMLNGVKDDILCVRGNCEAEVDQMVLEFPVMADYAIIADAGHFIYATHGHLHGKTNPPPLRPGSILLCGHTHIPACTDIEHGTITYMNPGSVAIPKEESPHSYMVWEGDTFIWKRIEDGSEYLRKDRGAA